MWKTYSVLRADDRFCCVGSHAHSHSALAKMKEGNALNEMVFGKQTLEKITGMTIKNLSYPLGNKSSVSRREAKLAERAAYEFAFTMEREANISLGDPLLLARIDCNDLPRVGKYPRFQVLREKICRLDGSESRRTRYFVE